ncbi:hypothetical protein EV368DRAFT_52535 [Lentinula lateritia]|nr:hypothetical protein EV368DRAFT_52535 [Lentinula lateritia]
MFCSSQGIPNSFFADLDHNELDSFGMTCRWCQGEKKAFLRRSLKVESVLARFFSVEEICQFHDIQSATRLLLSGSASYQFFSRESYDTDLDMYCMLRECLAVGQWYMSAQYMFKPKPHQLASFAADFERVLEIDNCVNSEETEYGDDSIVEVWDFQNSQFKMIQLIAARHSAVEVILCFHSTCVMNFISHRAAYALFPRTTFKDKATLILDNGYMSPGSTAGVEKYVRRGLKVIKSPLVARILDPTSDVVAVSPRFVNDSRTWCVPIEYHGRTKPQPDFAEANSFEMVYQRDMNKIMWMVITGPGLVHRYIAAPSDWALMKLKLRAIHDLMDDGILQ